MVRVAYGLKKNGAVLKPAVCILASQYFGWGAFSGFGSMPRQLARSLAANGVPVTVITQRRGGQRPLELIDGVALHSYSALNFAEAGRLIRASPARIFHSQNPSLLTYLAQMLRPDSVHLVTCRDPHYRRDWAIEFRYATVRRRMLLAFNYLSEASFPVRLAVRSADGVFCTAEFLREKVRNIFSLRELPGILPNLITVPLSLPRKSEVPTFVFVARWDKRKRPWLFLNLVRQFPQYRFLAIGESSALGESGYSARLRRRYENIPNLEMPGIVNQFEDPGRFSKTLSAAWVLVNTAARESLPLTFLEAAAHGCALLSAFDPEQLVSRFGEQVRGDDFGSGLRALMEKSPIDKGRAAYEYMRQRRHEHSRALAELIKLYTHYSVQSTRHFS
jgi:glycosyltransferase involved in cell wall biosynthesis